MSKAHFIGICGAGMSAVAKLLKDAGWTISGSDEGFYPPISDYLVNHNIPCKQGYKAVNIPEDTDLIVIGKHAKLVPEDNPEVEAAFASGKRVVSYPEVIYDLTKDSDNYVVAGSFGKSTCSALASWILMHSGKDLSYMVGALSPSLPENARLGHSPVFIMEGDEYPASNWDDTSKFIYYNVNHLLLTSGEHDHVNIFPTLTDYLKPFKQLVAQAQLKTITACLEGANIPEILKNTSADIIYYSLNNTKAHWHAGNIQREGLHSAFDLVKGNEVICRLSTTLLGEHNIENIVGVSAFLLGTSAVTPNELAAAISLFKGVRRRLELKTSASTIPLYEDFGSSRAKLLAGLKAVREQYLGKCLHVVFEPHTFSFRNRGALPWYDDLFKGADDIYIFDPPAHGAATHDQLTQDDIVARVSAVHKSVHAVTGKEDLLSILAGNLQPGNSVILVETSGNIGGAVPYLVDYLESGS